MNAEPAQTAVQSLSPRDQRLYQLASFDALHALLTKVAAVGSGWYHFDRIGDLVISVGVHLHV